MVQCARLLLLRLEFEYQLSLFCVKLLFKRTNIKAKNGPLKKDCDFTDSNPANTNPVTRHPNKSIPKVK